MTGQITIDVEKSTTDKIVISPKQDPFRIKSTKYISLNLEDWEKSPFYQMPVNEKIYADYVSTFLEEFTRLIWHIPIDKLINLYPHAWIFPSDTHVLVGRDGVAFVYDYPSRPDNSNVIINNDKILDELLLPHLQSKNYTSNGPNIQFLNINDDEHFTRIIGDNNFVYQSELGNPCFIIKEKRFHGFWENLIFKRNYVDGTFTKSNFKFVEFYGDISSNNFTEEIAVIRARIYAENWVTYNLTKGKINNFVELRNVILELKKLVNNKETKETQIEKFMDKNPWLLERGLGYKSYYSQVTIKESKISQSDHDIRPDKFLVRNDGYCDILDLKTPNIQVLVNTSNPNRIHASSKLTEAEAQVDKYTKFVSEPIVREELMKKK